eukprot:gene13861-19784_t
MVKQHLAGTPGSLQRYRQSLEQLVASSDYGNPEEWPTQATPGPTAPQGEANPNTQNKTPVAILHEYASNMGLGVTYDEVADSQDGPFTITARLIAQDGSVKHNSGSGRGRTKKDARQVSAAATLEALLPMLDLPPSTTTSTIRTLPTGRVHRRQSDRLHVRLKGATVPPSGVSKGGGGKGEGNMHLAGGSNGSNRGRGGLYTTKGQIKNSDLDVVPTASGHTNSQTAAPYRGWEQTAHHELHPDLDSFPVAHPGTAFLSYAELEASLAQLQQSGTLDRGAHSAGFGATEAIAGFRGGGLYSYPLLSGLATGESASRHKSRGHPPPDLTDTRGNLAFRSWDALASPGGRHAQNPGLGPAVYLRDGHASVGVREGRDLPLGLGLQLRDGHASATLQPSVGARSLGLDIVAGLQATHLQPSAPYVSHSLLNPSFPSRDRGQDPSHAGPNWHPLDHGFGSPSVSWEGNSLGEGSCIAGGGGSRGQADSYMTGGGGSRGYADSYSVGCNSKSGQQLHSPQKFGSRVPIASGGPQHAGGAAVMPISAAASSLAGRAAGGGQYNSTEGGAGGISAAAGRPSGHQILLSPYVSESYDGGTLSGGGDGFSGSVAAGMVAAAGDLDDGGSSAPRAAGAAGESKAGGSTGGSARAYPGGRVGGSAPRAEGAGRERKAGGTGICAEIESLTRGDKAFLQTASVAQGGAEPEPDQLGLTGTPSYQVGAEQAGQDDGQGLGVHDGGLRVGGAGMGAEQAGQDDGQGLGVHDGGLRVGGAGMGTEQAGQDDGQGLPRGVHVGGQRDPYKGLVSCGQGGLMDGLGMLDTGAGFEEGTVQGHMFEAGQGAVQEALQGHMLRAVRGAVQGAVQGHMLGAGQVAVQGAGQGNMWAGQGAVQGHMLGAGQVAVQGAGQGHMFEAVQGAVQGNMWAGQGVVQGQTLGGGGQAGDSGGGGHEPSGMKRRFSQSGPPAKEDPPKGAAGGQGDPGLQGGPGPQATIPPPRWLIEQQTEQRLKLHRLAQQLAGLAAERVPPIAGSYLPPGEHLEGGQLAGGGFAQTGTTSQAGNAQEQLQELARQLANMASCLGVESEGGGLDSEGPHPDPDPEGGSPPHALAVHVSAADVQLPASAAGGSCSYPAATLQLPASTAGGSCTSLSPLPSPSPIGPGHGVGGHGVGGHAPDLNDAADALGVLHLVGDVAGTTPHAPASKLQQQLAGLGILSHEQKPMSTGGLATAPAHRIHRSFGLQQGLVLSPMGKTLLGHRPAMGGSGQQGALLANSPPGRSEDLGQHFPEGLATFPIDLPTSGDLERADPLADMAPKSSRQPGSPRADMAPTSSGQPGSPRKEPESSVLDPLDSLAALVLDTVHGSLLTAWEP